MSKFLFTLSVFFFAQIVLAEIEFSDSRGSEPIEVKIVAFQANEDGSLDGKDAKGVRRIHLASAFHAYSPYSYYNYYGYTYPNYYYGYYGYYGQPTTYQTVTYYSSKNVEIANQYLDITEYSVLEEYLRTVTENCPLHITIDREKLTVLKAQLACDPQAALQLQGNFG